ncbi:TRAP transporter large permease [Ruegeria sp. HKCCD8929]|uniref:TRAP transporter large permease n=1 Tax=Ruegeria sp. HKCCD8929 TaxID=2683006 RepID=UPI0014893E17|nr:TRAP transporter large permease [Ruegeria sp. HKCCD8929]
MTAALIAFAFVIALSFFGVRIGFASLTVGFLGVALERGWNAGFTMVGQQVLDDAMNYNLSVIPLFILMGTFIHRSEVSNDLYNAAYAGLSRIRGGLAHSTVVACAGFSAVCGSSLATAATMTKVGMPSMQKFEYSPSLATGTIAAGGTLGIMIPPSVPLVIYGLVTQQDIGLLFLAGIIPGLLLVLSFLIVVGLWVRVSPDVAPFDESGLDKSSKRKSVFAIIPILGLFVLVLGGIYGKIFTPTEAAGVGATGAAVIALTRGHLWKLSEWRDALVETVTATAGLFMVLFGALVFLQYITLTGMPFDLMFWVEDMGLSPLGLVIMVTVIALLMGMVFEAIGILLLLVPVFLPALELAGVDLIWFGIIIVLVIELGLITPPIGINVFVVSAMVGNVPLSAVFRGVLPFVAAMLVVLLLLIAVPGITTFLPKMAR